MTTTTKLTGKQIEIATKVGKAIAKSTKEDGLDTTWSGLEVQDVDVLEAAGLKQGTPEWELAEAVAREAYESVFADADDLTVCTGCGLKIASKTAHFHGGERYCVVCEAAPSEE